MIYKSSESARDLIKKSEVLKLKAYQCPAGKWTIGYGHTGGVKEGQTCTVAEAETFLSNDIASVESALNRNLAGVKLTQGQFDALTDFTFNIGITNFLSSTLFRMLKTDSGNPEISKQFGRWVYGGDGTHNQIDDDGDGLIDEPGEKQRLGGLAIRRQKEALLFLKK